MPEYRRPTEDEFILLLGAASFLLEGPWQLLVYNGLEVTGLCFTASLTWGVGVLDRSGGELLSIQRLLREKGVDPSGLKQGFVDMMSYPPAGVVFDDWLESAWEAITTCRHEAWSPEERTFLICSRAPLAKALFMSQEKLRNSKGPLRLSLCEQSAETIRRAGHGLLDSNRSWLEARCRNGYAVWGMNGGQNQWKPVMKRVYRPGRVLDLEGGNTSEEIRIKTPLKFEDPLDLLLVRHEDKGDESSAVPIGCWSGKLNGMVARLNFNFFPFAAGPELGASNVRFTPRDLPGWPLGFSAKPINQPLQILTLVDGAVLPEDNEEQSANRVKERRDQPQNILKPAVKEVAASRADVGLGLLVMGDLPVGNFPVIPDFDVKVVGGGFMPFQKWQSELEGMPVTSSVDFMAPLGTALSKALGYAWSDQAVKFVVAVGRRPAHPKQALNKEPYNRMLMVFDERDWCGELASLSALGVRVISVFLPDPETVGTPIGREIEQAGREVWETLGQMDGMIEGPSAAQKVREIILDASPVKQRVQSTLNLPNFTDQANSVVRE